jgi:hypothetical protein
VRERERERERERCNEMKIDRIRGGERARERGTDCVLQISHVPLSNHRILTESPVSMSIVLRVSGRRKRRIRGERR